MKATDLKVGTRVSCFWLGGNAAVKEIKGSSVYFSCETPSGRISNLNYNLSKKAKKMNLKVVQRMMNLDDKYKLTIL